MKIVVTGSRTYAPVSDVHDKLTEELLDKSVKIDSVHAFGTSPASHAAIEWAAANGIPYHHSTLNQNRANLYMTADQPDTYSMLFVCRASNAKSWTEGMAQIIAEYRSRNMHGANFDVFESELPGRICEQITNMRRHALEYAAIAGRPSQQSDDPAERSRARKKARHFDAAVQAGIDLTHVAKRIYGTMEDMLNDKVSEDDSDYLRALRTYTVIEREKRDALELIGE